MQPQTGQKRKRNLGAVVAGADVLGGGAGDVVRGGEAGERGEDAAGALLTGEAVADAGAEGGAVDADAEV